MTEEKAIGILKGKIPSFHDDFIKAREKAVQALEHAKKINIVLASLEAEAEFCHNVAFQMECDKMDDAAGKMRVKEEAFLASIAMIREDLGVR